MRYAFYTTSNQNTILFAQNFAKGALAHGDVVDVIHDYDMSTFQDYDGAIHYGTVSANCSRVAELCKAAGKHFIYIDKGYMGRGDYWRASVDAWQPLAYFQRFRRPDDRFVWTGVALRERERAFGPTPIVLAGSSQIYCKMMGLGDANDYYLGILKELRRWTDHPIVYRPKPAWVSKHPEEVKPVHKQVPGVTLSDHRQTFARAIAGCHLLVTHGSNACVEALASGVPVMALGPAITRPLSLTEADYARIESPLWPNMHARRQLFADLAYCQWSAKEFKNGIAWVELRAAMAYLEGSEMDVIDQYKEMHRHPKYFRGLTTLVYADQIGALIKEQNVKTLLDYGSGKGEQYMEPHNLHKSWGTGIACYDPGVPEYASLPPGVFDGVICCDVMEHIPEERVEEVLEQVMRYATKLAFFSIATSPANKNLPDGRNCHLTVKPAVWWAQRIMDVHKKVGRKDLRIEVACS